MFFNIFHKKWQFFNLLNLHLVYTRECIVLDIDKKITRNICLGMMKMSLD